MSAYGSQSAMSPTIVIVAHYDAQNVVPVSKTAFEEEWYSNFRNV